VAIVEIYIVNSALIKRTANHEDLKERSSVEEIGLRQRELPVGGRISRRSLVQFESLCDSRRCPSLDTGQDDLATRPFARLVIGGTIGNNFENCHGYPARSQFETVSRRQGVLMVGTVPF